jgi:antitoxin Phd
VHRWQLQDAKARLSEVVKNSVEKGPQEITVRGRTAAVLVSVREYRRLRKPRPTFLDWIRASPLVGSEVKVARDRSPVRSVKL